MKACECTCRGCPSERESIVTRPVLDSDVAIVFEMPSQEAATRDAFYASRRGGAGGLISGCLESVGIDLDEVYTCSALNCRPNRTKEAMMKRAMLSCRSRLVEELKEANVRKVLCLGTVGFSALVSAERNLPITYNRGKWHEAYGMDIMATFAPDFLLASPDWFRDFEDDLEKFTTTDGAEDWPNVNVWVPETLKEATEALEFIMEQDTVSCDLETNGLSPVKNEVIAAGFGVLDGKDGTTVVIDDTLLKKKTAWRNMSKVLASDKEVVFHNGKFDLQFFRIELERRGLPYTPNNIHDTMLLHYTIDERPMGKFRSHVLERLASTYYDAPDYGIDMKKFIPEWMNAGEYDKRHLRKNLHVYLGLDCYYTARLFPDLWNKAMQEDEHLLDLYEEYLLPGSLALADIEAKGILIDRQFYEDAAVELDTKAKKILGRLQRTTGIKDFNPSSPKQVKEYVYDHLGLPFGEKALKAHLKNPNRANSSSRGGNTRKVTHTSRRGKQREGPTSKAVLKTLAKQFPDHRALLMDIVQYRNLTKNAGTYVKGMIDRVDVDSRIRGNFNLHGTATGRLSSDGPNLQNIPDSSHTGVEVRNGFIAPKGSVLIEADYSQLELRIAAWLSGDDDFKEVFIEDRDVHQEVTWALFKKTKQEATKYERYMAKCMNFGVMYQRGAGSLANGPEMDYIEETGGTRWSEAEVKEFFDRMLRNWARFNEWISEQQEFVYKEQYVKSPTGRKRRFPFLPTWDAGAAGRAAVNTPIQGTASDFTLSALIRIHHRLPEGAYIVSTVHDSILIECKRTLVKQVLQITKEEMEENLPFETDVPFKSDADVAAKWGQMGKYDWDETQLELILRDDED